VSHPLGCMRRLTDPSICADAPPLSGSPLRDARADRPTTLPTATVPTVSRYGPKAFLGWEIGDENLLKCGMVQSQVTGRRAERSFLHGGHIVSSPVEPAWLISPSAHPPGTRNRTPRTDRPGRVASCGRASTPFRPCAARKRCYLEISRNFFPKTGQRLRPIFPPNCKVCVNEICKTQHCIDRH
jgi:hypothetical protein